MKNFKTGKNKLFFTSINVSFISATTGHATKRGVIAALPNTQKQTKGGCQNEETKKHGPNERTVQNSRKKKAKQNGDKQSIRCRVQNTGYKGAQGTQDLSNIKKIQPETKDTLIEIQNNLQGNNSRVDKAKNQINDL